MKKENSEVLYIRLTGSGEIAIKDWLEKEARRMVPRMTTAAFLKAIVHDRMTKGARI